MEIIKKLFKNKDKKGISLLIAVLVGSTALLVGFALANLAFKELVLTGSIRDSEIAFYAANSGVECGLFEDLRSLAFNPEDLPGSVACNGQQVGVTSILITPGLDQYCVGSHDNQTHIDCWVITTGNISLETGDASASCFNLRVVKEKFQTIDGSGNQYTYFTTALESRGYNTCDPNSPRRLERAIRALY
jgi:hypothetical protein